MDSPLPFARGRSVTPRATRSRRVDSPTATSQRRADIQRSRCQALQRFEALADRAAAVTRCATAARGKKGYAAFCASTYRCASVPASSGAARRMSSATRSASVASTSVPTAGERVLGMARDSRDPRLVAAPLRVAFNEPLLRLTSRTLSVHRSRSASVAGSTRRSVTPGVELMPESPAATGHGDGSLSPAPSDQRIAGLGLADSVGVAVVARSLADNVTRSGRIRVTDPTPMLPSLPPPPSTALSTPRERAGSVPSRQGESPRETPTINLLLARDIASRLDLESPRPVTFDAPRGPASSGATTPREDPAGMLVATTPTRTPEPPAAAPAKTAAPAAAPAAAPPVEATDPPEPTAGANDSERSPSEGGLVPCFSGETAPPGDEHDPTHSPPPAVIEVTPEPSAAPEPTGAAARLAALRARRASSQEADRPRADDADGTPTPAPTTAPAAPTAPATAVAESPAAAKLAELRARRAAERKSEAPAERTSDAPPPAPGSAQVESHATESAEAVTAPPPPPPAAPEAGTSPAAARLAELRARRQHQQEASREASRDATPTRSRDAPGPAVAQPPVDADPVATQPASSPAAAKLAELRARRSAAASESPPPSRRTEVGAPETPPLAAQTEQPGMSPAQARLAELRARRNAAVPSAAEPNGTGSGSGDGGNAASASAEDASTPVVRAAPAPSAADRLAELRARREQQRAASSTPPPAEAPATSAQEAADQTTDNAAEAPATSNADAAPAAKITAAERLAALRARRAAERTHTDEPLEAV